MASAADASDPQRASVNSHRNGSGRTRAAQNPQQQLSTIEKSVTHLLVATKQLLETLTLWSRGSATEGEVSDVYVRLGYEFNIACRAFNAIGVDCADLGPVPDLLRSILEDTLSQDANQGSLDKFLPRIRDIIINLLHGLKKKQQRLRAKNGSLREGESSKPPRAASTATNLTDQPDDPTHRQSSSRSFAQRVGSGEMGGPDLPPRTTSAPGKNSPRKSNLSPANSTQQQHSRETLSSDSGSSLSSNAAQNIPVIAPYPETETMPSNIGYEQQQQDLNSMQPGPRPPPRQNDALTALQRGGDLERRASRRFSQYQINKQLGTNIAGIPSIPPAQNSPIPNRGRNGETQEGLSAVRSRASVLRSRTRSRYERRSHEPGASADVRRISERTEDGVVPPPAAELPAPSVVRTAEQLESPIVKTPEDKLGPTPAYPFPNDQDDEKLGATLNGPISDEFIPDTSYTGFSESVQDEVPKRNGSRQAKFFEPSPPQSQHFDSARESPQPGKELTLFLQYKTKIKKFVVPDGGDLSIGKLQLAFIEKFAWNTHNNGVDLPDIYIQDSVSGVRYELEDLSDIRDGSVLALNVEALDEVKRHIDDGFGGFRQQFEDIKTAISDQQNSLQLLSSQQQKTASELANIASAPVTSITSVRSSGGSTRSVSLKGAPGAIDEIYKMKREVAVMKQTWNSFHSNITGTMGSIRALATKVKKTAADAAIPNLGLNTGRAYVKNRVKELAAAGEQMLDRADDVQDTVEDLRKDVVARGVRPHPRQLDTVNQQIAEIGIALKKHRETLKKEKPVWTKQWERDLQDVCDEKEAMTVQEEICGDLAADMENLVNTFTLVEQACKQQNLQNPKDGANGTGSRSSSKNFNALALDRGVDPNEAKEGVLGEVRALQPNHESRLEAIERAEKARQRELASRKDSEFTKELGNFVEEGKLKKSGGVEEVERQRKIREEKTRKEVYERQQERERLRAEKEAAAAAAQASGTAESAEAAPAEDAEATENSVSATDGTAEVHPDTGHLEVPPSDCETDSASPNAEVVEAMEDVATPSAEAGP
ncbi:bud site selection protein 6-like [Teratosphaeria destructans]|uniref:Bud site selection protein 6-like n=1 Tax=Teratosphaeria destructans TaxID=418781 RepID=A0A9W7VXW4_9PEZI|nr:bud site selection protein 6-like [Teratosphaeria destructans]